MAGQFANIKLSICKPVKFLIKWYFKKIRKAAEELDILKDLDSSYFAILDSERTVTFVENKGKEKRTKQAYILSYFRAKSPRET